MLRTDGRLAFAVLLVSACGGGAGETSQPTPTTAGTMLMIDLDADLTQSDHFYDVPYPSDLRLTPQGTPILQGFPNPKGITLIETVRAIALEHVKYPVLPVAYFRFTNAVAAGDAETVIAAEKTSPVMLVDVDASSPERGKLIPVVAVSPPVDMYVPEGLLAVAPRPGFILHGNRTYAFVVMRSLGDAAGLPLAVAPAMADLAAGKVPAGAEGAAAQTLYAPLWKTLGMIGVSATDVAAATVFTTGDVVLDLSTLATTLVPKYPLQIQNLTLSTQTNDRVCMLVGKVTYPQFQTGTPPFDTGGLFANGADGLPVKQREEDAPIAITIPRMPMPAGGYPLVIYFHGSGGTSDDILNAGPSHSMEGPTDKGTGPAYNHAVFGFADAGSALPLNPERLPGASDYEYLNINNIAAMRDTFRQGVIEEHMFIEALRTLTIDPALLAACAGPTLPPGETGFHFNAKNLVAQGQSMGGMYTNLIGATEPRIRAVVPTGAGGFWTYFILKTPLIPNLTGLLGVLLQSKGALTFLHPAMSLVETGIEPSDPIVFTPRLARDPLPMHPVRPIYEPVGYGDEYFPTPIYDAMSLAYGNEEAGASIWPSMQAALTLDARGGILPYPLENDLKAEDGTPYTGGVVQYKGDGIDNAHYIYRQLDAVKYQYGCFLSSFVKTGIATLPAPAALGTPCP